MSKIEQYRESLHRQLGGIINQEVHLPGVLLTIGFVDLSPDLKRATIGVSVLPDKFYGSALTALRQANKAIRGRLSKALSWRLVPKLSWEIDSRPKNAADLEDVFRQIGA